MPELKIKIFLGAGYAPDPLAWATFGSLVALEISSSVYKTC